MIDPCRAFLSLGAAILEAQWPKPLSLLLGPGNWLETVESNLWPLVLSYNKSPIYSEAWSGKARCTWSSILKLILFSTGSQCNDFSTGMLWSNFFVPGSRILYTLQFWDTWLRLTIWESITMIPPWTIESMSKFVLRVMCQGILAGCWRLHYLYPIGLCTMRYPSY